MWPFEKRSRLPGVEWQPGAISITLTDEEQAEVDSFFRMMKESSAGAEKGTLYVHPEAHKAMTAWGLIGYAQSQVLLADESVVDKTLCLRKALAAATKAYSLHSLPIYMFDMACIFEMLGDAASARDAFGAFVKSQRTFKPSDVDRITMERRDVEAATKQALERLR